VILGAHRRRRLAFELDQVPALPDPGAQVVRRAFLGARALLEVPDRLGLATRGDERLRLDFDRGAEEIDRFAVGLVVGRRRELRFGESRPEEAYSDAAFQSPVSAAPRATHARPSR
jgi:hypothetical protein